MKKSQAWRFLVLMFFCGMSVAEANTKQDDTTAKSESSSLKAYELPGQQWSAWQKIQQEWMKKQYPQILQQQGLKMNCSGCENIYLDVLFSIDATGKLTHYTVVNSKKCADKLPDSLVKKFTAWFFTLQFPPELHSLTFEARLGTGLTC